MAITDQFGLGTAADQNHREMQRYYNQQMRIKMDEIRRHPDMYLGQMQYQPSPPMQEAPKQNKKVLLLPKKGR